MNFSKKCIPRRHSIAGGWLKSMVGVLAALCLMHLNLPASEAVLNPPVPFVRNSNGQPDTTVLNDGAGIIKSRQWAVVLGKALFWDQQAGSDGNACASCHFHAGADTRLTNQLTPGFKDITFGPNGDSNFGSERSDTGAVKLGYMPSGTPAGANYTLTPADMPLHRLVDETNRNSAIISLPLPMTVFRPKEPLTRSLQR